MKIACISDIHSNYDYLNQVLTDINKTDIDKLIVLGDIIGYYEYPDKVLRTILEYNPIIIKGSHELMLQDAMNGHKIDILYQLGIKHSMDKLTTVEKEFLINLPEKRSIVLDNKTFLLCHGSPWDVNMYIYPDADEVIFDRILNLGYDYVLMGHTHRAFTKKTDKIINVGSVGQPRTINKKLTWCLIDTKKGVKINEL
jgi:putative phosphoesterase